MFLDDFKARFPEFDETTVDQRMPGLEAAWPAYYGGKYPDDQEVILNLVAHLLTVELEPGGAAVRGVQSRTTGPLSTAFIAVPAGDQQQEFYGSTKYGQRFLILTAKYAGAVFV